ncbi:MAG: TM1812 family CRISPR-associated protein [Lacibacter sp.]
MQKSKKLIIQCGRLDFNYKKNYQFVFNSQTDAHSYGGEAPLSSHFLVKDVPHFKEANILFIFPISILHQNWKREELTKTNDEFLSEIAELNEETIVSNVEEYLKKHPHVKGFDYMTVSSLGTYSYNGVKRRFEADFNYISTQIYLRLIHSYSYDELEEVYIDISSGQNIYVTALLNAIYRFLPYMQLKRLYREEKAVVKAYVVNADPIIPGVEQISISLSEFRAKAFNTLVVNRRGQLDSLLARFDNDTKKLLKSVIEEEYPILHICLMRGFILGTTLIDAQLVEQPNDIIAGVEQKLLELYKPVSEKANNYRFDFFHVITLTFALALFQSLVTLLKKKEVYNQEGYVEFDIKENVDEKKDAKHQLDFSHEKVEAVYEVLKTNFGFTKPGYKGELVQLSNQIKAGMDRNYLNDFKSIAELGKLVHEKDYKINVNFSARNFFAHEGMEKTVTTLRVVKNKLQLKYKEEMVKKIKESISKYAFKQSII